MAYAPPADWNGTIGLVQIGATTSEGGTRKVSYRIGGNGGLPFVEPNDGLTRPLVAYRALRRPHVLVAARDRAARRDHRRPRLLDERPGPGSAPTSSGST